MSDSHGNLKIISSEITNQKTGIAVYWETIFEDEKGNRYICKKSSFLFDLEEVKDADK